MKYTPLYGVHVELGAHLFTTAAGYRMPAHYGSPKEEHKAVRERVGMSDHSLMSRFDVKGKNAMNFLQNLAVNDLSKVVEGQLMYTQLCNDQGNLIDDITIWRFNEEHFRVVSSSIMRGKTMKWLVDHALSGQESGLYVSDVSSSLGMITVQGPKSRDTLRKICEDDLSRLKFFHFLETKLKGDRAINAILARVGFTGELGYECYFNAEDTVDAWELIKKAGIEYDIVPYGLDTLDSLRFEKGYIFYGYEVTDRDNPFECGLERWIAFNKGDFIGKQALLKIRESGPSKKLMAIDLLDYNEPVPEKLPVKYNGTVVGETVAYFRGLTIGKNISWAWLAPAASGDGKKVFVNNKGSAIEGRVLNMRIYDPQNARMR
jgi:aminomethyltransferase